MRFCNSAIINTQPPFILIFDNFTVFILKEKDSKEYKRIKWNNYLMQYCEGGEYSPIFSPSVRRWGLKIAAQWCHDIITLSWVSWPPQVGSITTVIMPNIASYCDSYSLTLTEQSSCVSVREFINIINIDVSRFLLPSCVTKNKRSVSMGTMVTV